MRPGSQTYINVDDYGQQWREDTPWYWRLTALAASWMILGGYLLLPGLYAKDAQLKFSEAVLSVFVVALFTAGYSFTALLCFACRNQVFQAEGIFLPTFASSALGLVSIAYNFLSSRRYVWSPASITGLVISITSTLVYGGLFIWMHRHIVRLKHQPHSESHQVPWSEPSFYTNFVYNMYPTAVRSPPQALHTPTEDDRVNQQMALLRMKDSRPSPDANSSTYKIDLPQDDEDDDPFMHSQELVGTLASPQSERSRHRANSSLGEQQAWDRLQDRGRSAQRPSSPTRSNRSRGLSREERRREIELGHV